MHTNQNDDFRVRRLLMAVVLKLLLERFCFLEVRFCFPPCDDEGVLLF